MAAFWKKKFFLVENREKSLVTLQIFNISKKIVRTSVDNIVLNIPLKFQVDRIKDVRVLLLAALKNAVLRKTRLKV